MHEQFFSFYCEVVIVGAGFHASPKYMKIFKNNCAGWGRTQPLLILGYIRNTAYFLTYKKIK